MTRSSLAPGFRFHPTDVELVLYYLKRKVLGKRLRIQAITELDLYKFAPEDLPDKSCWRSGDLEWYFFCPKDKKYSSGPRTNRATEFGYWKTTGRDRPICNDSQTVGMKKTLIFHEGRAPCGTRKDWVMHEYRLEIKELADAGISQDSYVLCKIFKKSGAGPKNGEQHGAPFKEEEWEDDLEENSLAPLPPVDCPSATISLDDQKNTVGIGNLLAPGNTYKSSFQPPCANASSDASIEFDMETIFANLGEDNDLCNTGNDLNKMPELLNYKRIVEASFDVNDIFDSLEDLNTRAKLNGIDNLDLADIEDHQISGDTLLGGGIAYVELDDLDCPMKYPLKGNGLSQYDRLGSRSEIECGNKLCHPNRPRSRDSKYAMGSSDLDFAEKYPLVVNSEIVAPGEQNGCYNYDSFECFSIPSVASEALPPASGVGSSRCMLPRNSGVFASNLDVGSSDRFGFEGTSVCAYEIANQPPENRLGGNGERVNINSSNASATGEQNTANSRLRCLLGSIPAPPAYATQLPFSTNAGRGSNGKSLFATQCGASIHVKAEVTNISGCTEEAFSGKLGEFAYCCYDLKFQMSELDKKAAACSSGFTFVFILGVFIAFMWVFLFSIIIKLDWCTWKLAIA